MIRYRIKKFIKWIRWGKITSKVKATAGDSVAAEIAYYDRFGREIGYWAYGSFDPTYPYQGQ